MRRRAPCQACCCMRCTVSSPQATGHWRWRWPVGAAPDRWSRSTDPPPTGPLMHRRPHAGQAQAGAGSWVRKPGRAQGAWRRLARDDQDAQDAGVRRTRLKTNCLLAALLQRTAYSVQRGNLRRTCRRTLAYASFPAACLCCPRRRLPCPAQCPVGRVRCLRYCHADHPADRTAGSSALVLSCPLRVRASRCSEPRELESLSIGRAAFEVRGTRNAWDPGVHTCLARIPSPRAAAASARLAAGGSVRGSAHHISRVIRVAGARAARCVLLTSALVLLSARSAPQHAARSCSPRPHRKLARHRRECRSSRRHTTPCVMLHPSQGCNAGVRSGLIQRGSPAMQDRRSGMRQNHRQ